MTDKRNYTNLVAEELPDREVTCSNCHGRGYHTHGVDMEGRPWPDCGCCAGRGYHYLPAHTTGRYPCFH